MYAETLNKSEKLNIEMIIIDKVNFQTQTMLKTRWEKC